MSEPLDDTDSRDDPLRVRIAEAALELIDEVGFARPEALLEKYPECEAEIEAALHALGVYQTAIAADRSQARAGANRQLLDVGDVLGDYEIVELLGRGNMGQVYRAKQRSLGERVVALKVLPPELVARDPRFLARFRREAALAAEVHDPRLAEVYGFGEERGLVFFAMQLVEGRTLSTVLAGLTRAKDAGELDLETETYVRRVVALVLGAAEAAATLHKRGLVHRDIKPSNILLHGAAGDDFEALAKPAVLVDFGLLRPVEDSELTGSRTLLGTPAYAPPEARLGQAVDARADVFALGALLYTLLSLTPADARRCDERGTHCVRNLNRAVDARLDAVVRMALETKRELRYTNGAALAAELLRYLAREPVAALPESNLGRFRLWRRRYPERSLSVILVGIVIAGALSAGSFFIGGWAYPLYHAAGIAAALEQEGDLAEAAQAWRPVFQSGVAEWLPFLPGDVKLSKPRLGDEGVFANALAMLRTELDQKAHEELERVFVAHYPGPDADIVLGLLAHELTTEGTRASLRREAAAAAARIYLDPRARPHTTFPAGSAQRKLFDALVKTVEREAEAREPLLLEYAVAALGGTETLEALPAVMPTLADKNLEAQRVAYVAMQRLWWAARGEPDKDSKTLTYPALVDLDHKPWVRWAQLAFETEREQLPTLGDLSPDPRSPGGFTISDGMRPFLVSSVLRTGCCLAWTRMELRDAGALDHELWTQVPAEMLTYIDVLEDFLRESRAGHPPQLEAFTQTPLPCDVHPVQWQNWHRPFAEAYARWAAPQSEFQYERRDAPQAQRLSLEGPALAAAEAGAVEFVDGAEPIDRVVMEGAIERVAWIGVNAPYKSWGPMLTLDGTDSKLAIDCLRPPAHNWYAKVELCYDAPACWPLPHTGGSMIHVSANEDELELTRFGHADSEVLSFNVPYRALMQRERLHLEINLRTGGWLWLYWVKITFVKVTQLNGRGER